MNEHEKNLLDRSAHAMRADVPDQDTMTAAAHRAAQALGIPLDAAALGHAIQSCSDVQGLFAAYRGGTLPEEKALLVKSHLLDCGVCLRQYRQGTQAAVVDWSAPRLATRKQVPMGWRWASAAAAVLVVTAVFLYRAYWQVPAGVRAEVQSVDGTAFVLSGNSDRAVRPGARLLEGDELRTGGGSHAVLRLADGSLVEMNERSTLDVGARGHNMTVALDRGAVIVQAAHRTSGHLYVRTPDLRVAVTGTVFSVDAGLKGSRVAVLQGAVQVAHAGRNALLHPGDQFASSDTLAPEPIAQQIAWSPDREKYIGIMAQLDVVEHRIAQIPFPEPRYSSDLLARVPADTVLYISIPNLGDFLAEANRIFQDQLNQSPELQQWWRQSHAKNPNALNELIGKLHDVSGYLGNEIVAVGFGEGPSSGFAVVADVQRSGLADELQQQFSSADHPLLVLTPATLASAPAMHKGGYALVRDREVIFSGNLAAIRVVNAQLDAGASGMASSDFGRQIVAAYNRGAGMILAANLHAMFNGAGSAAPSRARNRQALEDTGFNGLQYLIAEHREVNGMPANHLNLQFAGTRQRIASWLAAPAPMGSLDFVTPNASIVAGTLTKDPAAIADDLMQMASDKNGRSVDWSQLDEKLQISVRDDLMANLSGEFLLTLDGPVLPTPSWKLVIGVNNPDALENALERMTQAIRSEARGSDAHPVTIESATVGGRVFYDMRDTVTGTVVAYYTFADGYMIAAADRALVMEALRTHDSGNSLARSASFRALLPHDENENYSALAYQNLSPVLTPLLSQFGGETADALRTLAADSRPTVICAWGQDNRIELASDSRLYGFDFLTLGALLHSGNNAHNAYVKQ